MDGIFGTRSVQRCGHFCSVFMDHGRVSLDGSNGPDAEGLAVQAPQLGTAVLRAAPRLGVAALAAAAVGFSVSGGIPGIPGWVLDWLWLPLSAAAVPSSPRRWWRYVQFGRPERWRVSHSGTTCLFVTDPGRNRVQVAARLREHGPLDLREAVQRLDDPTRPIWDDLTDDSAGRLGVILEQVGAAVRVGPRA
jgi:hypothetical protein